MTRAAANHYIGVLVIDEIQRLSVAKSGGAEILLNFFIQLVNEIGIPVVLVGTYKALQVLSRQFSQMRRGTGQGDLIWDRMQNEEEWQKFVKKLFRAQYTHKKFAPDDPAANSSENKTNLSGGRAKTLSDVLYDESQGITDLAVKLYIFAQERAIDSRKEIVNESVIRSVARDKFKTLRAVLTAIRMGDERALSTWDDVYPAAVRKYLEFQRNADVEVDVKGHLGSTPQIQSILSSKKSDSLTVEQLSESTSNTIQSQPQRQSSISDGASDAKNDHRKDNQGVLPNLIANVDKNVATAAYDALKKGGYVGLHNTLA